MCVEPDYLVAMKYTCRYCRGCNLLVAHKHEIEHRLTTVFNSKAPEMVGNDYAVFGTLSKEGWRKSVHNPPTVEGTLRHARLFAKHYDELRVTVGGWHPIGREPPIRHPPPPEEWIKQPATRSRRHRAGTAGARSRR
jgi:hypothetical protein